MGSRCCCCCRKRLFQTERLRVSVDLPLTPPLPPVVLTSGSHNEVWPFLAQPTDRESQRALEHELQSFRPDIDRKSDEEVWIQLSPFRSFFLLGPRTRTEGIENDSSTDWIARLVRHDQDGRDCVEVGAKGSGTEDRPMVCTVVRSPTLHELGLFFALLSVTLRQRVTFMSALHPPLVLDVGSSDERVGAFLCGVRSGGCRAFARYVRRPNSHGLQVINCRPDLDPAASALDHARPLASVDFSPIDTLAQFQHLCQTTVIRGAEPDETSGGGGSVAVTFVLHSVRDDWPWTWRPQYSFNIETALILSPPRFRIIEQLFPEWDARAVLAMQTLVAVNAVLPADDVWGLVQFGICLVPVTDTLSPRSKTSMSGMPLIWVRYLACSATCPDPERVAAALLRGLPMDADTLVVHAPDLQLGSDLTASMSLNAPLYARVQQRLVQGFPSLANEIHTLAWLYSWDKSLPGAH